MQGHLDARFLGLRTNEKGLQHGDEIVAWEVRKDDPGAVEVGPEVGVGD
jgi:hypothetical protein